MKVKRTFSNASESSRTPRASCEDLALLSDWAIFAWTFHRVGYQRCNRMPHLESPPTERSSVPETTPQNSMTVKYKVRSSVQLSSVPVLTTYGSLDQ